MESSTAGADNSKKANRYALGADGAIISGGAFLSDGFAAVGEVRMLRARISGQLICDGGTFSNPGSHALGLDGVLLDADLSLGRDFVGNGRVVLNGASVRGTLSCDGGSFKEGLWLERATIGSTLSLREFASKPEGPVDLSHARVGQLTDDEASWPKEGMLFLDGFEYGALAPGSPTDGEARLRWLNLQRNFSPQSFHALARALRSGGHDSAARKILIALENRRSAGDSLSALQRIGRLFYRTIGYGYEPRFWGALLGDLHRPSWIDVRLLRERIDDSSPTSRRVVSVVPDSLFPRYPPTNTRVSTGGSLVATRRVFRVVLLQAVGLDRSLGLVAATLAMLGSRVRLGAGSAFRRSVSRYRST